MALNYTRTSTQGQTPGTLATSGMFYQPPVPNQSQAGGIQGTDGRAYTRNVSDNELVQNQLNSLLGQSSPYMRLARQSGLAQAASRGLGNSSIAAGASQREAIKAGLPIAAQDAQTYANTQSQNMEALNQNLMQERQIANEMLQAEKQLEAAYAAQDAQLQAAAEDRLMRLQMQRENLAYSGEQQGLDRAFQNFMANQGYQFDLGRMGAEYGYDLGRAQQGYDFDIGRMGYGDVLQRGQMGLADLIQRGQMGLGSQLERERMADQFGYNLGLAQQGFGFDLQRAQQAAELEDMLANNASFRQEWLASNNFNRDLYGNLLLNFQNADIQNSSDFYSQLSRAIFENPEVFGNPEYASGLTNFFRNEIWDSRFDEIFSGFFGGGG